MGVGLYKVDEASLKKKIMQWNMRKNDIQIINQSSLAQLSTYDLVSVHMQTNVTMETK